MKRIFALAAFMLAIVSLSAQTSKYEQRYNLLVSKLGPTGVGVETVLDAWAQADSTDEKLLAARFNYYLTKAQRTEIVKKQSKKYLGMTPLLTLKDSTGVDIHYYQEVFYDDELFGKAIKSADKAISLYPDKVDYRFMKANAYISYEKESPDMALQYLMDLIAENSSRKKPWIYNGEEAEASFMEDALQEYCYSFYQIGAPQAREAFYALSIKLNSLYPENLSFINNIGSYYMVAKEDYKTALKYYKKVLKKDPEDLIALQNGAIAAKKIGDAKLENKYRTALAKLNAQNN